MSADVGTTTPQPQPLQAQHLEGKTEKNQTQEPPPSRDASLIEQATRVDDTAAREASGVDHDFTRNPLFVDRSNPSRLSDWLLLSGCAFAREHGRMRDEFGITAVVNLTPDDFGCADAGFEVLQIPIDDAVPFHLHHVQAFLAQMQRWSENGATVLIHCHAGISRTSTFAIAWLMHVRGANADSDLAAMWSESEDAVQAVRPIIMPHYLLKRAVLAHFAAVVRGSL